MSNVAFTANQLALFSIGPRMDAERRAIVDRVEERMSKVGMRGWPDLALALGEDKQLTNNWRERGIPPSRHASVAKVLGWSVDELLGRTTSSPPASGAWPFPNIPSHRFNRLSESERLAVESAMVRAMEELEAHKRAPRAKKTAA